MKIRPQISRSGPVASVCCAPIVGINRELDADRVAAVAMALAKPIRVRILDVLRRNPEPVCQCELLALFDMPQPTLSHHVAKLADVGLVHVERRHRWAYYSISPDTFKELTAWLS